MLLWRPTLSTLVLGGILSLPALAAPAHIIVLGPDAKPLAGAAVRLLERVNYYQELPLRDLTTDANGALALELSDEAEHTYEVRVLAPGLAVAGQTLKAGETTIQLQAAKKWGGSLFDANQKPVAGAQVSVITWRSATGDANFYLSPALSPQATTDAQGNYTFDSLPATGYVQLDINAPGFQRANYTLDLSDAGAPPLFLKPGATVKGRIVTGEGKPLTGADIAAYSGGQFQHYRVANDGTFTVNGLTPAARELRSFGILNGWVLPALPFEPLKAGETRVLPDWVATRALAVKGLIVDSLTKKPLSNVKVEVMADASQSKTTDAKGQFTLSSSADIIFVRLNKAGYVENTLQRVTVPKDATQFDLGTVELQPGTPITGTVNDEKGAALPYFDLLFENRDKGMYGRSTGQKGQLSAFALAAGTYTVTANNGELISPKTLIVPPLGKPLAPVQFVLKRRDTETTTKAAQLPFVTGRVVSAEGKPVAGAIVTFKSDSNTGRPPDTAISNHDGHFHTPYFSTQKPQISAVERPGFVLSSGGEATKTETGWQTADIVLTTRGQIFTGQVLIQNQPVANAWVALAGNNWREPVQTDAMGTFHFEDLPGGEVELLAASPTTFAHLKTRSDAKNVVLNLETVPPTDATAIANDILKSQKEFWTLRPRWDLLGDETMERLALQADDAMDADGTLVPGKADDNTNDYFRGLARRNPARLLERGPQLLPLFRPGQAKWDAEATLARVQAASTDPGSQKAAQTWLTREKVAQHGLNEASLTQLLAVANVAFKLKDPQAQGIIDFALAIAQQLPTGTRDANLSTWASQIALIGSDAVDSFCQDLDAPQQMTALSSATRVLAHNGDLASAQRNLERLKSLQTDPKVQAADKHENNPFGQQFDSGTLLSSAQIEVAKALAPTDAATALQIVKATSGERNLTPQLHALLDVALLAHQTKQDTAAVDALRAVFQIRLSSADYGAQAASIAQSFDPKLGAELFQKAREQAKPGERDTRYQPSIAMWAYQYALVDPALSRVMLEREWSWRLPAYQAAQIGLEENGYNYHEGPMRDLAWAMAALDPQHALAWVEALPDKNDERSRTKALIATAILANQKRQTTFDPYPIYSSVADY